MAAKQGVPLTPQHRATLRHARLRHPTLHTFEALANKVGVSPVAIIRYEGGDSNPSIDVLRQWAAMLGYEAIPGRLELRKIT